MQIEKTDLDSLFTPERAARMKQVVQNRTRFHTFVLDDVHKSHNISAIFRSLDGFGFQDVYLIHKQTAMAKHSSVSKGSEKWLSLHHYQDHESCLSSLSSKKYRIVTTSADGLPLTEVDWTIPSAIVMGAELRGVHSTIKQASELSIKIPMHGFVESFNVSVAVACIAFYLRRELESSNIDWRFSQKQQDSTLLTWQMLDRIS